MAIVENELLKNIHGRIGEYLLYRFNGKTCLRRLPAKENITMSPKMLEQQERIASLAALHQALKHTGMEQIWQTAAKHEGRRGYNLLIQHNLPAFNGLGQVGDYDKLLLSVGRLQLPNRMKIEQTGQGEFTLTWEQDELNYPAHAGSDKLEAAWMKEGESLTVTMADTGNWQRHHCRAVIRLPPDIRETLHLYCFFRSENSSQWSASRHFPISGTDFYNKNNI